MFNAEKFLNDYRIPHKVRNDSWVVCFCPLCHSISGKSQNTMTGAFSQTDKCVYTCFRCGGHSIRSAIQAFLGTSIKESYDIINKYDSSYKERKEVYKTTVKEITFTNTKPIDDSYIDYLNSRGFNPIELMKKYGLMFTNHYGDLANRIIIPIKYNERIVSYTSRTILKGVDPRYISCSSYKEVINHKNILFNLDNCKKGKIVVVEAPMNVMKGGNQFCATFGTEWTTSQLNILKEYSEVYIIFDSGEYNAQKSAKKLCESLSIFTKSFVIDTETPGRDVGDFTKDELIELCKYLGIDNKEYFETTLK